MKVLHPTDFSASSLLAIETGSDLAEQTGGTLTVCHVRQAADTPLSYLSSPMERVVPTSQEVDFHYRMQSTRRERENAVQQQLLSRLHSVAPRASSHDLLSGDLLPQLVKASENQDLVVMSWGETTRDLIRWTRTPLLCLPSASRPPAVKRLLVGIDFGAASLAALEWCRRLERYGFETVVVHVAERGSTPDLERRLEEVAKGRESLVSTGTTARTALPELAADLRADAVVLGGKGRPRLLEKLFQGTAAALLGRLNLPILVVRQ